MTYGFPECTGALLPLKTTHLLNLLDHVFSSNILLSLLLDCAVDAAKGARAHHPDVVIQLLVLLAVPGHRHVLRGHSHPGHRGRPSL